MEILCFGTKKEWQKTYEMVFMTLRPPNGSLESSSVTCVQQKLTHMRPREGESRSERTHHKRRLRFALTRRASRPGRRRAISLSSHSDRRRREYEKRRSSLAYRCGYWRDVYRYHGDDTWPAASSLEGRQRPGGPAARGQRRPQRHRDATLRQRERMFMFRSEDRRRAVLAHTSKDKLLSNSLRTSSRPTSTPE